MVNSEKISCDATQKKNDLAYYHNPGSEPYKIDTIGQLIDSAALKWPNKQFIISHYENITLTYSQAKEQAEKLATGLLKLGLKPGDRLALLGVNTANYNIALLAAAKTGIILALLNPAYTSQELDYALKKVGAKGILTDRRFRTQDYPAMLAQLVPSMSSAPHAKPLSSSTLPDLSFVIVATEEKLPGCYRLQDIMSLTDNKEILKETEKQLDSDYPFLIIYSSGTSGSPKAAVLSHFRFINDSYIIAKRCDMCYQDSIICNQLPLFHAFGVTVAFVLPLLFGQTLVLPSPAYSKDMTIDVLSKYSIDFLPGTPTMQFDVCHELKKLLPTSLKHQEACKRVRLVGCSGAYLSQELIDTISDVFPQAYTVNGYGMTEISNTFTTLLNDTTEKKKTTVGYIQEYVEVKIVDKDGKMVPFGCPGEAWFRSRLNMLKYWGDEEKTKETINASGWLKTGDVMILYEDGYASIVGRLKDVIIRGGENIFPAEIETCINQHPEVLMSEVYGVSDVRLGEEVAASVILAPSSNLTESSIREYCQGKIAHFKIPKHVRFVSEFPVTATRKVKKYVLKETHENELKKKNILH